MKSKLLAAATAAFLLATAAKAEDLLIGTSADYPPWESVDPSGKIIGLDVDLGLEICKRIQANCTFTNQSYDGLLPGLSVGKFDLVMSAVSMTEARMQKVDFSQPYAKSSSRFVVKDGTMPLEPDSSKEAVLKELDAKVVGTQVGSAQTSAAQANLKGVTLREYERADQMFEDVRAGRVDAILLIETAAADIIVSDAGKGTVFAGPSLTGKDFPELGMGFGIALKKGNQELKARLDGAIASMVQDGTIKQLSEKYLGKDVTP
ncbi:transporter substrate-binding domain-containing protein [Ensifer sp. ENS05]|uniref:transporter substrate-binding domain-containing protein n=1 Tax=Ensifer sp. ENS05 TaxID=2769277 RepID=UPI0017810385|nr:transporter substrate-binding domain-containing protein [Ensifer sp. ENS05]MBD9596914.1 transporter substrate-binding domain-containing protein [Ensifer sp. ENS05]